MFKEEIQKGGMRRFSYLLFFITFFFLVTSLSMAQVSKGAKETGMKEIREPAVAGMFYPDQPDILARDIKRYIENAKKERIDGEIVALVSPHADTCIGRCCPCL
jgi:hypothetical protein